MATTPNWKRLPVLSIDNRVDLHSRHVPVPWESLHVARHTLALVELRFLAAWRRLGDEELAAAASAITAEDRRALLETLERFGVGFDDDGGDAAPPTSVSSEPLPATTAADVAADETLIFCSPQAWTIEIDGFARYDHDGRVLGFVDPIDLWVARHYSQAATIEEVWNTLADDEAVRSEIASQDQFAEHVARLVQIGVIVKVDDRPEMLERSNVFHNRIREGLQLVASIRKQFSGLESERRAYLSATAADHLIPVYAVIPPSPSPPLALGAIYSATRVADDPRLEAFDLHPRWVPTNTPIVDQPLGPAIYLFSDYLWTHETNLAFSKALKDHNPEAITIHGGPDCPSYERDSVTYLDTHQYVDIAVRGEGEDTAIELLGVLAEILAGASEWQKLETVAGIAFRGDRGIVRTADRDRITDLDTIPSPFLDGTFAAFEHVPSIGMAIIETNRGCPYGCTFCDWGSATNSRIRKFDLDRVKAELDWCAKNQVQRVFFADANFGIFSRDVEIASHFAHLRREHGYPKRFITNYAKNTVKHLTEIVSVLTEAGVVSEGLLSLQSLDESTLTAIRRSNIKLEKYEALAAEFRSSNLPLFVDLMMGLPGQTVESLHRDLQECVDRGVFAKCHGTELLVNSPMNEPEYRESYAVESTRLPGPLSGSAASPAFVVSTTSFTRADYAQMHEMRRFYLLAENHGVLRYVAPLVRQNAGIDEVDLYERVRTAASADQARWPWLSYVSVAIPDTMAPPPSWKFFIDELRRFLVQEIGLAEDDVLETALLVQHAMLPDPGRMFPVHVELPHDYPAWLHEIHAERDSGNRRSWQTAVEPLSTFGPALMTVDDPRLVSATNTGHGTVLDNYNDWELDAPVSRAVAAHYTV